MVSREDSVGRAGILPYTTDEAGVRHYLVYHFPDSPNGKWMIAKGRQHVWDDALGEWRDVEPADYPIKKPENLESFSATARREGEKDLGLAFPSELELTRCGLCHHEVFDKHTKKHKKIPFMLYTTEVFGENANVEKHFLGEASSRSTEGIWITMEEFRASGRLDHVVILQELERFLFVQDQQSTAEKAKWDAKCAKDKAQWEALNA